MFNHKSRLYICPFCRLVQKKEVIFIKQEDIVYQDDLTVAFISPKWWVNNPGHVVVIPKEHYENVYDIPDNILSEVYITAKKIAIAMKTTYQCEGTSMRQHNEPAGNQDVWHFHTHVFPRFKGDDLYLNNSKTRLVLTYQERKPYTDMLREYFSRK